MKHYLLTLTYLYDEDETVTKSKTFLFIHHLCTFHSGVPNPHSILDSATVNCVELLTSRLCGFKKLFFARSWSIKATANMCMHIKTMSNQLSWYMWI